LAVGDGLGVVRLVAPDTETEYARLEVPAQTSFAGLCFTPDGTRLVAAGMQSRAIHVWDLRLIGQGLAALGLAWDLPLDSQAPPRAAEAAPLQVELLPGDRK
jgi:hypothetical protein